MSNVSEDVVWSKEKSLGDFNYTIMKIGTKAQVKCWYKVWYQLLQL